MVPHGGFAIIFDAPHTCLGEDRVLRGARLLEPDEAHHHAHAELQRQPADEFL
jgi:hypothetical protein